MVIKERDLGYTSSAQSVWNELYIDPDTDKIYDTYLTDNVDIYLFNTRKLYDEIKNKRRKSYSIVYEALLSLFQTNVDDYLYPKKVRVTSEMVQSWFKKHNADFKEILKPVVAKVDEYRQEIFEEGTIVKEYIDDSVKPLKTNGHMKLDDLARSYIRNKLRKEYDVNSFKTDLNTVTDNILDEFLRYINDEASGFLINELTYEDGLVKGSELRNAVQEFIDFDLRENDINEYDFNESTDSRKHPYWMDDDVGFDIPDLDDRDIYGDEDFDESVDVNEARDLHTWSITYTGKGNKAKTHMVDAPDAYEANRKARRELGISYSDIDDITMVENKEAVNESIENEYGETLYKFIIGSGTYQNYVYYAYGYSEDDALDKVIDYLERTGSNNIYTFDEIENEGLYDDEYVVGGNHGVALRHYGEFRIEIPDNDNTSDGFVVEDEE